MSEELDLIKMAIEEAATGRPNQYNLTRARDAVYILESREAEQGRCPICKCQTDEDGSGHHSADCVDFRATMGEWYKMRKGEDPYDTLNLIEYIREMKPGMPVYNGEYIETEYEYSLEVCQAAIGQYAYRYSEDIREHRDEWKDMALKFVESVNEKEARR
jgi:hypothetical protein